MPDPGKACKGAQTLNRTPDLILSREGAQGSPLVSGCRLACHPGFGWVAQPAEVGRTAAQRLADLTQERPLPRFSRTCVFLEGRAGAGRQGRGAGSSVTRPLPTEHLARLVSAAAGSACTPGSVARPRTRAPANLGRSGRAIHRPSFQPRLYLRPAVAQIAANLVGSWPLLSVIPYVDRVQRYAQEVGQLLRAHQGTTAPRATSGFFRTGSGSTHRYSRTVRSGQERTM